MRSRTLVFLALFALLGLGARTAPQDVLGSGGLYAPWPDNILAGMPPDLMQGVSPLDINVADLSFPRFYGFDEDWPFDSAGQNGVTAASVTSGYPGNSLILYPGTGAQNHDGMAIAYSPLSLGILDGGNVTFIVRFYKNDGLANNGEPADAGMMLAGLGGVGSAGSNVTSASVPLITGGGIFFYTDFNSDEVKLGCSGAAGGLTTLASSLATLDAGTWITLAFRYEAIVAESGSFRYGTVTGVYVKIGNALPTKVAGPVAAGSPSVDCGLRFDGFGPIAAVTRTATEETWLILRSMGVRIAAPGL